MCVLLGGGDGCKEDGRKKEEEVGWEGLNMRSVGE